LAELLLATRRKGSKEIQQGSQLAKRFKTSVKGQMKNILAFVGHQILFNYSALLL
jgi:hypothetical protein